MTGQPPPSRPAGPPATDLGQLQDAEDGLRSIREVLRAAETRQADAAEVGSALAEYWLTHRPVLREAGVAVLEALRLQALDALYRWRDQLNAQLGDRPRAEATTDDVGRPENANGL
jgi:hypothetical protein